MSNGESLPRGYSKLPEYKIWSAMKARCYKPSSGAYPLYGGRGITVCEAWRSSFQAFLRDMGFRPTPMHSLDRADNNGGYCPSNCRWVEKSVQAQNRRVCVPITIGRTTLLAGQWIAVMESRGLTPPSARTILHRIRNGVPPEAAVTTPAFAIDCLSVTIGGEVLLLSECEARYGISSEVIRYRIKQGWEPEEAVRTATISRYKHRAHTHNGRTQSVAHWAAENGVPIQTVRARLGRGWSVEDAVFIPTTGNHRKRSAP